VPERAVILSRNHRPHASRVRLPLVGGLAKVLLLASASLHPAFALAEDPTLLKLASAAYPPAALRKRQQGWVELEFTVGIDGRVRDVAVVKSEPPRVFDREAVRAMQQSTYKPAREGGEPVESRARQKIEFKL
jgi:protein TonB